jgi:adenylate cyclase
MVQTEEVLTPYPPMLDQRNTRPELQRLLQERLEHPEAAGEIDAQIYRVFERECAILVLDLSGFSRLTIRRGIIHFLAMVHRMTILATPIVHASGGRVVKQEADNLFAAFTNVPAAIATAIAILQAFELANLSLPDEQDLHASIGIGYGNTLIIGNEDLYGSEMNLACKLGEDLAQRGELLLTANAFRQMTAESQAVEGRHPTPQTLASRNPEPSILDARQWERTEFEISGLALTAYRWRG